MDNKTEQEEIIILGMQCLGSAVTIIDREGTMLYYNETAPTVLDRKPEMIGKPIFACHTQNASNDKVRAMLSAFSEGRQEPFRYTATPLGYPVFVTVAPILDRGAFVGCIQSVIRMADIEST